jgi:5,10-methylenetetrahydromethanopterin reductase
MKFSVVIAPKIDDWQLVQYAEERGYHAAWVCDSQMIWSDCYQYLALAAAHTKRIRLGTGVAVPGTRIAAVTAHSIASIAQLAPGRTFLGIGTGHTAMRLLGQPPMRIREFREYLRVTKALLRGEEVDYELDGRTKRTRFLHRDLRFLNLEDPIPVYVAANGPLALRVAGEHGDGLMSVAMTDPELVRRNVAAVRDGAARAERTLPADYVVTAMSNAVVLRPGESATAERVLDETDAWVGAIIHFADEIWKQTGDDSTVPPGFRGIWPEYCAYVDRMKTPAEKRYLEIHDGHATYLPKAERRFMTEEAVKSVALVGTPEEILARVRSAAAAGVTEIALLPPIATARKVLDDFARYVIAKS